MTTDLRIAHLRTHYRMPADAVGERSRLDRVLQSAVDDELLTAALERAGVPAGEEICVRRVDSMVRLDSTLPDARLAVAWSVALAEAIAQRVRDGGPDVIRYRTRYHALVEMACAAARGDLERAWAWRSLGIWRAGELLDVREAHDEVLAALAREPRLAPATLGAVARSGLLPLLVSSVSVARWIALARASLVEWNVSAPLIDHLLGEQPEIERLSGSDDPSVTAAVARLATSSPIASAMTLSASSIAGERGMSAARSLAVLAMLDGEPALATSAHAPSVVLRLAQRMVASESDVAASRAAVTDAAVGNNALVDERSHDARDVADSPHADRSIDAEVREVERERATTSWGGLLFLLHLVRALDLPATLLRNEALSVRSLSWTLHELALRIVPLADDDPAALAFAGLAPGSRALEDDPPATDGEVVALREAQAAIVAALRERMSAASDESDAALINRVAARRAEVIAEQAWIDVRLAAREVNIDVRRAGLDLDLGWLPWLGTVVRFVYD